MQVDASQVGLDVVLLQDGKPVAHVSKALTPAEVRYANIEREMLAVVFGCLKYHHYLYSRRFVCRSDHQPLEKIHLKNLSDAPPRLQRLPLKMQPYDFEIKYFPGKEVALADTLNRVSPQDKMELKGLDFTIHELTPCMTPIQVSMIHEEQKKDTTMQLLIQQLIQGWPNHCKEVDPALNKYWTLSDDISIEDGCIAYLEYGNVEEIIGDNGKQFMVQEYKTFAAQCGFRLTTSSPYHPKGHGFMERQIQTIKKSSSNVSLMVPAHTWPCWN